MKKLKYIVPILILIGLTSCSESLLDTKNPNQSLEEDFWKTEENAVAAVYGMYNTLQNNKLYGQNIHRFESVSDNGYNEFTSDGYLAISEGRHLVTNGPITQLWVGSYNSINAANQILANVPDMDIKESVKNNIIGEAIFVRALNYLNLTTLFGDVPYIIEPIDYRVQDKSKDLVADIRNGEVSKLLEAVDLLSTSNPGRVNKYAAIALLGKYYLYMKQYDKAAEQFASILNVGYKLYDDYAGLFLPDGENSKEIIFAVKFENLPGEGNNFQSYAGVRPLYNFVDEFECTDGLSINNSPLYDENNPIANRDPRLDATVLRDGESRLGQVWDPMDSDTGYGYDKYYIDVADNGSPMDFYVIRFADVLLMYAEALNEANTTPPAAAFKAVNDVRGRISVNMPPISALLDKAQLREAIRHERRVELGFEGIRLFDVMRWGIAKDRYENGVYYHTRVFESPKHDHFPIPQVEMDNNKLITQNEGW